MVRVVLAGYAASTRWATSRRRSRNAATNSVAVGAHCSAWQYAGIFDVYRVLGAVALSSLVVVVYGAWRVPALAESRSIIYVDALLTTGLVAAGVQSLATGQKRIETPHLAVRYRAPRESTFLRA